MSDSIRDIISCLDEGDRKEFRSFINRQRIRKGRLDLQLFELLSCEKDFSAQEINEALYNEHQSNNYHGVRKRLTGHLTDFIVFKQMQEDTSSSSQIMALLAVSKFLFEKEQFKVAWQFLNRAEELSLSNEQFDLLDNVFNLMIEHATTEFAVPLEVIISKWQENKKKAELDEKISIACAVIKQKLNRIRISGELIDLNKEVKEVLRNYKLEESLYNRPKMLCSFLVVIRSSILTTKSFYKFEPIIEEAYVSLKLKGEFARKDHFYRLQMLYMLSHVKYRLRKFREASGWLAELEEASNNHQASFRKKYYAKMQLLKAACETSLGNNDVAILIVEATLLDKNMLQKTQELDLILNLSVYYFQREDFKKVIKTLARIDHSDKWLIKKMGQEWVARMHLISLLVQFEIGNTDRCYLLVERFEKDHQLLLSTALYGRTRTFLGFVKDCIDRPYWVASREYIEHVNKTLERWPLEREDIQAMGFYCWLKAKMLKKSYYEVLVATLNE